MTQVNHTCQNNECSNTASKDRYGNYKRYCSDDCKKITQLAKMRSALANKDMSAIREKRRATVTAKYGVDNVAQIDAVRNKLRETTTATADIRTAKTRETNLRNHGVESTNSLQSVKDRKRAAFMEKYGVDHQLKIPEVAASVARKNSENAAERLSVAAQTKLEVYGDENYNNRTKYVETCVEKFGVENPSQNAAVHEKQFKKRCVGYAMPSGNIITVQGYEPQALDSLLKIFKEEDIIVGKGNMPEFWYNENGKKRYFPDFYIPKENLIIEVKSCWTYSGKSEWSTTNHLKKQSCIDNGYKYLLMLYNNPGTSLLTEIKW